MGRGEVCYQLAKALDSFFRTLDTDQNQNYRPTQFKTRMGLNVGHAIVKINHHI